MTDVLDRLRAANPIDTLDAAGGVAPLVADPPARQTPAPYRRPLVAGAAITALACGICTSSPTTSLFAGPYGSPRGARLSRPCDGEVPCCECDLAQRLGGTRGSRRCDRQAGARVQKSPLPMPLTWGARFRVFGCDHHERECGCEHLDRDR